MAYTKIHPIESTLKKAIDYITNPNKTEKQKYCDGYACSPAFAAIQFQLTRERAKEYAYSNQKTLAYHLIQSFRLDEVTPEHAIEIGKKLADELLKGQYEYVISTHIDRENIHNHIIINAINFENNKSFSYEHDQFKNPAWKQIRAISDNLCKEYGLSVIQAPERGKGKSRYEWEQDKGGNSWKSKLRSAIDNAIITADSFDDFIKKMYADGYEIKQGKYISFRAKGQERFTRAKTIGYYYTEEQIRNRIERCKYRRNQNIDFASLEVSCVHQTSDDAKFININERIEQSKGLKNWVLVQNMKAASKIINDLAAKGVNNTEEIKSKIIEMYDDRLAVQSQIKAIEEQQAKLALDIKNLKTYREMRPVNEQYHKAKNKDKFFREHETELHLYSISKKAVRELLNENGKLPAVTICEKHYAELEERRKKLMRVYEKYKSEISALEKLQRSAEKMEKYKIKEREHYEITK